MIHVVADGISYAFGVFVEDFADYFDCGRSEVGMLGSLMLGVTWCTGMLMYITPFSFVLNYYYFSIYISSSHYGCFYAS